LAPGISVFRVGRSLWRFLRRLVAIEKILACADPGSGIYGVRAGVAQRRVRRRARPSMPRNVIQVRQSRAKAIAILILSKIFDLMNT
jgi:hypothetical protein